QNDQHQDRHKPEQCILMSRQLEAAQCIVRAAATNLHPWKKKAHQYCGGGTKIYSSQHNASGKPMLRVHGALLLTPLKSSQRLRPFSSAALRVSLHRPAI